jgi:uncharacterized protein YecE (DUF72 family)
VTGPPDLRVGTSGWHHPHWVGPFYPPGTRPDRFLGLYTRHFGSAEINNTFYRLPTPAAVAGWREATPPGFLFAAKGSRFITHMKKLKDPAEGLRRYLEPLALLGDKLGPVVFQLPPRWRLDLGRLAAFLGMLPAGRRFAFEFRDQSWFAPETSASSSGTARRSASGTSPAGGPRGQPALLLPGRQLAAASRACRGEAGARARRAAHRLTRANLERTGGSPGVRAPASGWYRGNSRRRRDGRSHRRCPAGRLARGGPLDVL